MTVFSLGLYVNGTPSSQILAAFEPRVVVERAPVTGSATEARTIRAVRAHVNALLYDWVP